MASDFYLSTEQLMAVARRMRRQTRTGLAADGGEIACIPTFVPVTEIPRKGRVLVLDLGGTNIRCAQACLENSRLRLEKGPVRERLTDPSGREMAAAAFYSRLAGIIAALAPENKLPLGYCFSYPARSTPDGDAVLLGWTKELFVSDMEGGKVGEGLCRYLAANKASWQCGRVRVINDTVAALLAGMAASASDASIGLIVGTGTNIAIAVSPDRIPKIDQAWAHGQMLPVNLESGNFNPPHLTRWDGYLDAQSRNPGEQRFEKAVSGHYLADLLKLRMPESDIDTSRGAAAVFEKAYEEGAHCAPERELARRLIERSARLTAAALAGVISFLAERQSLQTVSITAEGGVFWGHPAYREAAESGLRAVLDAMGHDEVRFEFGAVSHANLLGSAIAGLSG